jgi:hypothetical protein
MNLTAYVGAPLTQAERGWFYDYQTFIGAMIALLAALIAAEIARRQLAETKRQAARDRAGRLRAARASLPAVLSAVCDYAEVAGRTLNAAWPVDAMLYPNDVDPLASRRMTVSIQSFPAETLRSLERIVELTDNEAVADRIESILRESQVLSARTRKLDAGDNLTIDHLSFYILQTASIYARAESLFEYARRQSDGVSGETLWKRVFAALSIMGVDRDEVLETARHERDRGEPPGEADTASIY